MMPTAEGNVKLGTKNMNDVGKKLGYKDGDELVSINNVEISLANLEKALTDLYASLKEGDELTIKVKRKSSNGEIEVVTLSGTAAKVEKSRANVLKLMNNPTEEQLKIRNAWLNSCHR